MTEVQLLSKSEVWITGIHLSDVDLPKLAKCFAEVLGLNTEEVFVTDCREGLLVFDILSPSVNFEEIAGKQTQMFEMLRQTQGVRLDSEAQVHSEGVLGFIGQSRELANEAISEAKRMDHQIQQYASGRIAVISTGTELLNGTVRDTNYEAVKELLSNDGYEIHYAGIAGDSENEIAGMINRVASEGFGVIITTGGVGAEDKDKTVEAIELLDPDLATATLAEYTKGHGRHVKEKVRIGVASLGWTTIIALPGPTHEVRLALPIIAAHLMSGSTNEKLAEAIAIPLRATLPSHKHH